MFRAYPVALLALVALAAAAGDQLQIGVKYKPAECTFTSRPGDKLSMHYDGKLANGNPFDSSRERGQPFEFVLGSGQVIKGWDSGLQNMCPGEKRKLRIPPHLAYGERATGPIPAGSTLVFEVELLDILNRQPEGGREEL